MSLLFLKICRRHSAQRITENKILQEMLVLGLLIISLMVSLLQIEHILYVLCTVWLNPKA